MRFSDGNSTCRSTCFMQKSYFAAPSVSASVRPLRARRPGFGFRHFADCSGRRRSLRITAGRCFPRPNDCRPNRNEFRKPHMPADRRRKRRSRCTNSRPGCDFPPIERFFGNSVLFTCGSAALRPAKTKETNSFRVVARRSAAGVGCERTIRNRTAFHTARLPIRHSSGLSEEWTSRRNITIRDYSDNG